MLNFRQHVARQYPGPGKLATRLSLSFSTNGGRQGPSFRRFWSILLDSSSCSFSDPGSKGQARFKLGWRSADGCKRFGACPGVSGAALAGMAELFRATARFEELDERKVGTERLGNKTSIDPPGGRCRVLGKGKRRKDVLEARRLAELPAETRATRSCS